MTVYRVTSASALAVAWLSACGAAFGAPLYSLQRIDLGDVQDVRPESINDRGDIVGNARVSQPGGNSESFPFFRDAAGTVVRLPLPGTANAVNNAGEVLATGGDTGVYVWTAAGGARPIAHPATGVWTSPRDINDAGTIAVEKFVDGSVSNAARRRADGSVDEAQPLFRPSFRSDVMNASGAVAGFTQDSGLARPAVWEVDGTVRRLTTPRGGGQATAINDAGLVAGTYGDEGTSGVVIASGVWRPDGQFVPVALVPGVDVASQEPLGMNNLGQVVGYTNLTNHDNDAFYWSESDRVVDLQSLLDGSGAGWNLQWASDVNELGQIIGVATFQGGGFQGVLLTPVPEPTAAGVVAFTFAALALTRAHRLRSEGRAGNH
jgi:probable HAF family extracellular repeat protein